VAYISDSPESVHQVPFLPPNGKPLAIDRYSGLSRSPSTLHPGKGRYQACFAAAMTGAVLNTLKSGPRISVHRQISSEQIRFRVFRRVAAAGSKTVGLILGLFAAAHVELTGDRVKSIVISKG